MAHPDQPPFAYHHLGLYEGRIAGTVPMTQDMSTWEIHPSGDEFLCLLSGKMACILEEPTGERVVELRAGEACIVPQGVWHRLLVREPSELLFLTPGEGTTHRPISPNGQLTTKPWGTQEFAILDPAGVCITFYESVAQRPAIHS